LYLQLTTSRLEKGLDASLGNVTEDPKPSENVAVTAFIYLLLVFYLPYCVASCVESWDRS